MSVNLKLPRSLPEEQGVSSSGIVAFLEEIDKSSLELHSFMFMRHGHVVAEGWWSPYGPELPHMLFSLSKSFTSTAIGFAAAESLLSVDDTVISFFPDDISGEISENLASMRIRQLLCMGTGHAEDTTGLFHEREDGNWVKAFLRVPVQYTPGTHFVYNSGASYMLSAIIQKVTGQTLLDYLQPRLFEPLGIEDATWETCPQGISVGGWGLSIKTEHIAKFGQLYLQKGLWEGKRILSEQWVEEATTSHISNGDGGESDWAQGYGYQFWRCKHGAYRGDGAFGQYCVVMQEQDAVIAITGAVDDMQAVLNVIWKHLLPSIQNVPVTQDRSNRLGEQLSTLAINPPQMHPTSSFAAKLSGNRYQMENNEDKVQAVLFDFHEDSCTFTMWTDGREYRVNCGNGQWLIGETTLTPFPQRIAASGTWSDEQTYVMTWRYVETPFYDTITCHFEDDKLLFQSSRNVNFGPKERPSIQGKLV